MSECLSDNGPARAVALGKPVLETESKMWVDDIQAECRLMAYATPDPKIEIIAVVKGSVADAAGVPVRVHSECFTGDVLGSQRCDCGQQLHKFMRIMNDSACGVLLYIRGQEGRGIGLFSKIRAYHLQDQGHDTVDANLKLGLPVDIRSYEDALQVLQDLRLKSIRLFTNNPDKMSALKILTQEVQALSSLPNERNIGYLQTKIQRLNHRTVLETFKLPELGLEKSQLRIGLVYTTWNQYFVDELVSLAATELTSSGAHILKMAVPGANELISGCRIALRHHKPDAVIAVGVLIRGSSDLYDRTCNAVMSGLTELNAIQDTPIVLGILMCQNEEQASERSHGPNNPAKAWAQTAMHMASLARTFPGPGG
ncbi:ribBA [Symbiodinium natans]|uniref:RibBA protein n=1 Tax=Symbiodinium natans TaxID=878477 RepID=A0A812S1M4_9DINO|nr:ribBA [Symbiodinium natans]